MSNRTSLSQSTLSTSSGEVRHGAYRENTRPFAIWTLPFMHSYLELSCLKWNMLSHPNNLQKNQVFPSNKEDVLLKNTCRILVTIILLLPLAFGEISYSKAHRAREAHLWNRINKSRTRSKIPKSFQWVQTQSNLLNNFSSYGTSVSFEARSWLWVRNSRQTSDDSYLCFGNQSIWLIIWFIFRVSDWMED